MSEVLAKKCRCCKEVKMADRFYRDKSSEDGLSHQCKDCRRQKAVKNKQSNKYKKCVICRKSKIKSMFASEGFEVCKSCSAKIEKMHDDKSKSKNPDTNREVIAAICSSVVTSLFWILVVAIAFCASNYQ